MMVDQADGHARGGADAADGHALMAELLEAAQSRVHQCFAAHRGSCAVEFGNMPLGRHYISFSGSIPKRGQMGRRSTLVGVCRSAAAAGLQRGICGYAGGSPTKAEI